VQLVSPTPQIHVSGSEATRWAFGASEYQGRKRIEMISRADAIAPTSTRFVLSREKSIPP
jgi:hypothetical protein